MVGLAVVFGALVTLTAVLVWLGRIQANKEFVIRVTEPAVGVVSAKGSSNPFTSYVQVLRSEAEAMGQPERADLWVRMSIVGSVVLMSCAVLLRQPIMLFIIPVVFAAPLIYARSRRKTHLRLLREQTRLTEMVIAFLMGSGATLSDTLATLEREIESPMKERIKEVNAKKRYTTLPGALQALADATGVEQLKDFAMIVSESERYGTPVAEALLRSLQLDTKIRDANASKRYGNVQLQLGMYATLFIAMPGFGFVIYAMFAYMMKSFMGGSLSP